MVQGTDNFIIILRSHGDIVESHVQIILLCHKYMVQQCYYAIETWYKNATMPWRHGTTMLLCHGDMVQQCYLGLEIWTRVLLLHGNLIYECY